MENELLDFKAQENFDFFKYRYMTSETRKAEFVKDCQEVIKTAQSTLLGMLKLGWYMAKIKRDGTWKEVCDPETGNTFNYLSFEKFSEYAYGFKRTLTSNLLGVSEFVDYDEKLGTVLFKSAEYARMSMSKLVELIPLPDTHRKYFRADMTVKEMRLCKKYVNDGYLDFCHKRHQDGFDILASAQAWEERKIRQEEEKRVQEVDEELRKAASDPAQGEESFIFYDEQDEEEADEIPASGFETPIFSMGEREKERSAYRFTSRDKTLNFLADFQTWETIESRNEFFDEVKRFRFRTGAELFAATCKMCVSAELDEKALLFYFLSAGHGAKAIKISKMKLVAWLRAHEAELLGVEA